MCILAPPARAKQEPLGAVLAEFICCLICACCIQTGLVSLTEEMTVLLYGLFSFSYGIHWKSGNSHVSLMHRRKRYYSHLFAMHATNKNDPSCRNRHFCCRMPIGLVLASFGVSGRTDVSGFAALTSWRYHRVLATCAS